MTARGAVFFLLRINSTEALAPLHDTPLRRIELRIPEDDGSPKAFPFSLATLQGLEALELEGPVCCLVGENGSGKSTLLEALAIAHGAAHRGHRQRVEGSEP